MRTKFSVRPPGPVIGLADHESQTPTLPGEADATVRPSGENATPRKLGYAQVTLTVSIALIEFRIQRLGLTSDSREASPMVVGSLDPMGGIRVAVR